MNTTTQTASLKNVKKVFMIATAAEAIFILLLTEPLHKTDRLKKKLLQSIDNNNPLQQFLLGN